MDIVTKNKGQFLLSEWYHYKFEGDKYTGFISDMKHLVLRCKECRTYFWFGCLKRCKCKGYDEEKDVI